MLQAASSLQGLGDHDGALAVLARPMEALADDERDQLLVARTVSHLRTRNFPALLSALAEREALEPSEGRSHLIAALSDPDLREPVAEVLAMDDTGRAQQILQDLSIQHPDSAALRHVTATRGLALWVNRYSLSLAPDNRQQLTDSLTFLSAVPSGCDPNYIDLVNTAAALTNLGEVELADTTLTILEQGCSDPAQQVRIEWLRQRQDWEAAQR